MCRLYRQISAIRPPNWKGRNSTLGLVWAIGVKGVVTGHLLVGLACDISSSRSDIRSAARSGRQGWPKAIAQRFALDGREHSATLAQSGTIGRVFSSLVLR